MSEYAAQVKQAIERGSKYGLALREKRQAAGKTASDGGLVGSMPKILDEQLVRRFGNNYAQDDELMRDLRQRHPEMMAIDGDTYADAPDGVHTKRGRVKMKWIKGKWYEPDGRGNWREIHPPSKMNWGDKTPPMVIG